MSDIDYLEALEMMVRTLSGEPNVLEHMEKEGIRSTKTATRTTATTTATATKSAYQLTT